MRRRTIAATYRQSRPAARRAWRFASPDHPGFPLIGRPVYYHSVPSRYPGWQAQAVMARPPMDIALRLHIQLQPERPSGETIETDIGDDRGRADAESSWCAHAAAVRGRPLRRDGSTE